MQLCQKEPHLHYHVSFRKRRGVVQKSKGRLLRNRRAEFKDRRGATISKSRIYGIKTFVDKGKKYHHLILSLYMSTFVFYGRANLKKMPNSPSPLRAHSQQSLSKYSILSSSPKMIPDAWSTYDPGGNGRLKHVLIHSPLLQSKGISYHQGQKQKYLISCSFPVFFFVLVLTCMAK